MYDNFRKQEVHFRTLVYLHWLQVEFEYEGHGVKVKNTGTKNVENSYSHMYLCILLYPTASTSSSVYR